MKKILKGFSEKKHGSMYLSTKEPSTENIAHRKHYFENQGLSGHQIAVADLVHGIRVAIINPASPHISAATDALVTKHAGIILTLTGADCFPIFFEEKNTGIIGLAHGGWRGITAGIINETITAITALGGKTATLHITIGPGICTKHFVIKEDVLPHFSLYPEFVVHDTDTHVDLKGILIQQATEAGVLPGHITDQNECTYCLRKKYFSFRRDHPTTLEAQLAYIIQFPHRKF
jgi:polyphenol oxidase